MGALVVNYPMLKDTPALPVDGDCDRQWMADDYFDLIVWRYDSGGIYGFQLCYDKSGNPRALTWLDRRGFSHQSIDTGESNPTKNRAPVLIGNGAFPAVEVIREFERRASSLPDPLRGFVVKKICEFSARQDG
jgi:hypothetical protein